MGVKMIKRGSFEYEEEFQIEYNFLTKLDETHFVLTYDQIDDGIGVYKIFELKEDNTLIELSAYMAEEHDIEYAFIKMSDTIFLKQRDKNSRLRTFITTVFEIDENYIINEKIVFDPVETSGTRQGPTIRIDDTHFVTSFGGSSLGEKTYIKVIEIGESELIELSFIESAILYSHFSSFVRIDDTHFALAFFYHKNEQEQNIEVRIYKIDENYIISEKSFFVTLSFNNYGEVQLIKKNNTQFVLFFAGRFGDGFVKVLEIDENYIISEKSTLKRRISGRFEDVKEVSEGIFLLSFFTYEKYRVMELFKIDENCVISEIGSLRREKRDSKSNSIIKISEGKFILAYEKYGEDEDGSSYYGGIVEVYDIKGLTTQIGTGYDSITITWEPVVGSGKYAIRYKQEDEETYTEIKDILTTTYTINNLLFGEKYNIIIEFFEEGGL